MNPVLSFVAHLAGGFLALAAAVVGLAFVLSFVAWIELGEAPELRRGPARPRPFLLLALFTLLISASYLLIP